MLWLVPWRSWGPPGSAIIKQNYPTAPLALPCVSEELAGAALLPGQCLHIGCSSRGEESWPWRCWGVPPSQKRSFFFQPAWESLCPTDLHRHPFAVHLEMILPQAADISFNYHRNLQTSQLLCQDLAPHLPPGDTTGVGAVGSWVADDYFWFYYLVPSWHLLEHRTELVASVFLLVDDLLCVGDTTSHWSAWPRRGLHWMFQP